MSCERCSVVDFDSLARLSAWMLVPLFIVGTLLHFLYDWTGENRFVARFAAVNESYWEHIKIAFWPLFVYFCVVGALGGYRLAGFLPAATAALYAVPVSMIALVYTYKRVTRRNLLWLDILVFLVTMMLSLSVFVLLSQELVPSLLTNILAGIYLLALIVAFASYTLRPPADPDLFVDPLNEKYGLEAHEPHSQR